MTLKTKPFTKDGAVTPSEVRLQTPLFAHECFASHPTADDRVDRELDDDEPFSPPQECLDRVFSDLSKRLLEEDPLERRRVSVSQSPSLSPPKGGRKPQQGVATSPGNKI